MQSLSFSVLSQRKVSVKLNVPGPESPRVTEEVEDVPMVARKPRAEKGQTSPALSEHHSYF